MLLIIQKIKQVMLLIIQKIKQVMLLIIQKIKQVMLLIIQKIKLINVINDVNNIKCDSNKVINKIINTKFTIIQSNNINIFQTSGFTEDLMDIFDIIGPVMVGPFSSHTAGAVRIGYISQKLMGEQIKEANILLYGSFLDTGKGHGTNKAIVAGLLGMQPDDMRIPQSMEIAEKKGIKVTFGKSTLKEAHPNSAQIILTGISGKQLEVVGESLGGSRINIAQIDGITTNFSGDYPTLVVHNQDQPGHVSEVTSMLAHKSVNIATMQLYRSNRGGDAVMVLECDQEIPREGIEWLKKVEGITKVTYLSQKGD